MARYSHVSLTFLVSGLVHHFGAFGGGTPWNDSGVAQFFLIQAVGIMIEDAVQAVYRHVTGRARTPEKPMGWKAFVGYLWLLFWLGWTTPITVYPTARGTPRGRDPSSAILGRFLK